MIWLERIWFIDFVFQIIKPPPTHPIPIYKGIVDFTVRSIFHKFHFCLIYIVTLGIYIRSTTYLWFMGRILGYEPFA